MKQVWQVKSQKCQPKVRLGKLYLNSIDGFGKNIKKQALMKLKKVSNRDLSK